MPEKNGQDKVIKGHIGKDQLVKAPPGAGKTYSLIKKVAQLLSDPYNLGSEILVLSFTRSAVKEIKNRIRQVRSSEQEDGDFDDLGWLVIQTFDSFVTWALFDAAEDDVKLKRKLEEPFSEEESSYDVRISKLIDCLDDSPILQDTLSQYKHLVVDEAQDLVGVRADLVSKLAKVIPGGKTIFLDESQAIYNYLVKEKKGTSFDDFLADLKRSYNFEIINLNYDYRTRYEDLKEIKKIAREIIIDQKYSKKEKYEALSEIISEELESISIEQLIVFGKKITIMNEESIPKVAILCRNNGEVLCLADKFIQNGIFPEIRRGAGFKTYPAWIGRLFSNYTEISITKKNFERLWESCITESPWKPLFDFEKAWNLLKEAENVRRSAKILDLRKLKNHMKYFRVPDDLLTETSGKLILSTIHRAKGREFDEVYLLPQKGYREGSDPLDEAKILYVGMTRPIQNLKQLKFPFKYKPFQFSEDRWGMQFYSKNRNKWYYRFQVGLQTDFDNNSIINKELFPNSDECHKTQDLLWNKVKRGDKIQISAIFPKPYNPTYYIYLKNQRKRMNNGIAKLEENILFGNLSREFLEELKEYKNCLRGKETPRSMPKHINGIVIDNVVTEVSTVSNFEQFHLPYTLSGFWMGIRLQGLGYLYFKY